jgi:hypothetical protein
MPMLDFSETPSRGKATPRKSLKMVLGIGVISGAFALSSTLAANIALNDGGTVEFGQGITQTTACSDGQSLIVTPLSSFTNAAGAGSFKFTGVTVSEIPESCDGVDFKISAYNTSGDALAIFNEDSTVATIWNDEGTFKLGAYSLYGTSIASDTGVFTVSFTSPVALATNVSRVTLQSSAHTPLTCATGFGCEVGDIGPGGGFITFVSSTPFNCGQTGTKTCRHLEIAPNGWNGSGSETASWATFNTQFNILFGNAGGLSNDKDNISLAAIGRGYQNTLVMFANDNTTETAAVTARAYRGGGLSDWYLPNMAEVNQLCQWTNGNNLVAGQLCNGTGANNARWGAQSGGITGDFYWTSSEDFFNTACTARIAALAVDDYPNGCVRNDKNRVYKIRPVRAF